jgi:aminoglycoside phosphotransferase (APT) family kinase protein
MAETAGEIRHEPQLTEVRAAHRIDLAALSDYFARQVPELAGPVSARQFKDGQSNPTYLIEAGGRRYVMRKKPPGKLLRGAHLVEREFRAISALSAQGFPVPQAIHLCEDESVIGTTFYVMSHVPGGICQNPALPGMTAEERGAIYASMAGVLARLHAVDWRAAGLADYGKEGNYIERQIALWSRQYEAAKTDEIADMDALMAWLPENVPPGDETGLVHGDYRLGNIILAPDAPKVAAVLDWELSTLGHPLTDLAYNCLPYHLPAGQDNLPGLIGADLAALGIPSEEEHIAAYCRAAGRTGGIARWPFYIAFSMFRLASISQGVYARALQGNASAPNAMEFGDRAKQLARQALGVSQMT